MRRARRRRQRAAGWNLDAAAAGCVLEAGQGDSTHGRRDGRDDTQPGKGPHGAAELPSVTVTSYNLEIRDQDGFVGDKASRGAFVEHLDALRLHLKKNGDDPLEGETAAISKKALDALLQEGDPHEAALVLSAIERFAQSLAFVIRRFVRLKSWAPVERIVVGGGFRESRVGELAIGRAGIILQHRRPRDRARAGQPSPRRGGAGRQRPSRAEMDLRGL